MDGMSEWCNSFVLVPKANGKLQLCLDPARLIKVLIRLMHRVPTLNDIPSRLAGVKYFMLIDASLAYHNLKLDEQSSYLTTFSYPFGTYGCTQLPFGVASAGNMFQRKIDEIFEGLPSVFGISDDIQIAGFNDLARNMMGH